MNKKLLIIFLVLAFLGFLDATYLTILHYKNIIPPCTIAHGCEIVLTSKFATIGPVPIALLGSIYYITIMILIGLLLQGKKDLMINGLGFLKSPLFKLKSLIFFLTLSGFVVSGVLVYLQAFVIHAFCQYCLTSEAINLLLVVCAFVLYANDFQE